MSIFTEEFSLCLAVMLLSDYTGSCRGGGKFANSVFILGLSKGPFSSCFVQNYITGYSFIYIGRSLKKVTPAANRFLASFFNFRPLLCVQQRRPLAHHHTSHHISHPRTLISCRRRASCLQLPLPLPPAREDDGSARCCDCCRM